MNTFTGCLPDTRTNEEKAKDWHKDLAMSGVVNWVEKDFGDIKTFPLKNQDGSGSCVAQTLSLMLGIENYLEEGKYIEFSAGDIYTKRSNKDSMGMIGVEALEIARKNGCTLESLIPSNEQSESQINDIKRSLFADTSAALRSLNGGISTSLNPTINPSVAYDLNYKLMAQAMKDALSDVGVYLDERKLGNFIDKTVSEEVYS